MGRRTKLTAALAKKLCDCVRKGNFLTTAADHAGVARSVVYEWLARGEADDPPDEDQGYVDFALAYRNADAAAVIAGVRTVKTSKDKTRQKGAAWWLERRHPEQFGRRLKTELSGPDGGPIALATTGAVIFFPAEDPPDDSGSGDRGAGGTPPAS